MDKIIPIAILVLFIILTASWLFSRYRMCPPDKILIVFGKVGTGQPAKCYHGGSTFVLPVLQSYSYLDLNPINIDVPLQGALSSQNILVDVPSPPFLKSCRTPLRACWAVPGKKSATWPRKSSWGRCAW